MASARREASRRIDDLLETVDMSGRLHEKARSLSGGQMRRMEIARALLHRPPLLLLDEATVGLDVQSRAGILASIRRLVETDGISVLWATHLIDEVDDRDEVVVLDRRQSGRQRPGRRCGATPRREFDRRSVLQAYREGPAAAAEEPA